MECPSIVTKFFIRNLFSWRHFDVSSLRLLSKFNSDVIMWYFSVKHKLQDLPPGLNGSAWSSMLHVRIGSELFLLHSHTNFESSVELALLSF